MTRNDYVEDVKLLLSGSGIVSLEIEEAIPRLVDLAFKEIKHYITDTETLTIPYYPKMHIEDYPDPRNHSKINIGNVVYVQRSNSPNRIADYQDIMYLMSRQSTLQNVSLTDYNRALLINQAKNMISTDLDFYWDSKNKDLYVYANYPKPEKISIVYTPRYDNIEDVESEFWQNLIRRLATAYAKQVLGRVRGKYRLNSAQYELDSETLLAEATQEISEIRSYLDENSDILLPID